MNKVNIPLKEDELMIVELQEEDIKHRFEVDGSIDLYEKDFMDVRGMLRRIFPLHKKVQNLYKHNRSLKEENKNMKKELQMLKHGVSARNIKLLADARDKFDEIRP